MQRFLLFFALMFCFLISWENCSKAQELVHVVPAPAGEPLSKTFVVTVEKYEVPVYVAKVAAIAQLRPEIREQGEAAFASFDINGSVKVTVTYPKTIQSVKILPSNSSISPVINGKQVVFNVTRPSQLTLELNGDWLNSLHLFVNPFEKDVPRPDDPNVIYYGPGVHKIAPVKVASGKTIYVAGGAVVYGTGGFFHQDPVFFLNGSNIIVRGRGIIDGSLIADHSTSGNIMEAHGHDLQLEGVVFRNSATWTVLINDSNRVKVDNIKILGWRENSDGIDIDNSQDVWLTNSFFRTFDDLIVIKAEDKRAQETSNIVVRHNILWNEIAQALSIGAELMSNVNNVVFSDCDIIHDKGREWLLRVFNANAGTARHIVFDNLRIEESRRLISLWIGQDMWSLDKERGEIQDIIFSHIQSRNQELSDDFIQLSGFDAQHTVKGVRFEDVIINGRGIKTGEIDKNQFVGDVQVN